MKRLIGVLLLISIVACGCENLSRVEKNEQKERVLIHGKGTEDKKQIWNMQTGINVGNGAIVSLEKGFVKYINPASGEAIYACSERNCKHENEECQAFFGEACKAAFIDEEKLYVIYTLNGEEIDIECSELDGSNRRNVGNISFKEMDGFINVEYLCMINKCIYIDVVEDYYVGKKEDYSNEEEYIYNSERKKNVIYKCDVLNEKTDKIVEFPEAYESIMARMFCSDEYIFFERYYREKSLLALGDYLEKDYDSYLEMENAFLSEHNEEEYFEALGFGDATYIYSIKDDLVKELKMESQILQDSSVSFGNEKIVLFNGKLKKESGKYVYDIKNDKYKLIEKGNGDVKYIDNKIIYTNDSLKEFYLYDGSGEKKKITMINPNIITEYIDENDEFIFYQGADENVYGIKKEDFWKGINNTFLVKKIQDED